MDNPFNLFGNTEQVPPSPISNPSPVTPSATMSTPSPQITDEEVLEHILVNILLEREPREFTSAFKIAGITQPFHVLILTADEVLTLVDDRGNPLPEAVPLGPINKKLWEGMQRAHDILLGELEITVIPNEKWLELSSDDAIAANLAHRRVPQPHDSQETIASILHNIEHPPPEEPTYRAQFFSSILSSVKRDINA